MGVKSKEPRLTKKGSRGCKPTVNTGIMDAIRWSGAATAAGGAAPKVSALARLSAGRDFRRPAAVSGCCQR